MVRKLTDKQKVFVEAYLETLNATESARRAKYRGNGQTLRAVGHENLTKPHIREEIDRRLKEMVMSADEVLLRLGEQAKAEYANYMTPQGGLDLSRLINAGKGHLIKKIKKTLAGIEVEFYDAQAALVHLGKYHALFTDRLKVEDWRSEIIELLKSGKIKPEQVEEELGDTLATELFESAGVSIVTAGKETKKRR